MNHISGSVSFSGTLGYCQQNAWIQNLSVRENILFRSPFDEDRYWRAVKAAALLSDLELFADGDMTEIGERGVNLSGGQKSRLNIARALYSDADIILLDDPLSAVDAHVGLHLFEQAILSLKASGKTVVLVTHALHMLSKQVDYIYSIDNGKFVEQGTYNELMRANGAFKKLVLEYGGQREEQWEEDNIEAEKALEVVSDPLSNEKITKKMMGSAAGTGKLEGRLMKGEVRKTGSVSNGAVTYTSLAENVLSRPGWHEGIHAVSASGRSRVYRSLDPDCGGFDARLQYSVYALDHLLAGRPIQKKPELLHGGLCRIRHRTSSFHLRIGRDNRDPLVFCFSVSIQQVSTSAFPHTDVVPFDNTDRAYHVCLRKGYRRNRFKLERQFQNVPHDYSFGDRKVGRPCPPRGVCLG